MSRKTLIAALAVAGATATAAWAATPAETIAARQANYKQMGRAMKGVTDELKKSSPDIASIRTNAATLVRTATNIHGAFPRGSGPEAGVKTAALPIIWQRSNQFRDNANQLIGAAQGLQRAAAGGDLAQVRTAFRPVGAACKSCHDTFKGNS